MPLDVHALVGALDAKRKERGLSWRGLAQTTGVSASSLTRMQQGKRPDVDTFSALMKWLQLPAEQFLEGDESQEQDAGAFAVASTLLRGKRELSPKAQDALTSLVQAAIKLAQEMK